MNCENDISQLIINEVVFVGYARTVEAELLNEIRISANCAVIISFIIYKLLMIAVSPESLHTVVASNSTKLLCFWTAYIKKSF